MRRESLRDFNIKSFGYAPRGFYIGFCNVPLMSIHDFKILADVKE